MRRTAPNLDLFLWRPLLAEPPMITLRDLNEWVTLPHLLDIHEALDLRGAMQERAAAK